MFFKNLKLLTTLALVIFVSTSCAYRIKRWRCNRRANFAEKAAGGKITGLAARSAVYAKCMY